MTAVPSTGTSSARTPLPPVVYLLAAGTFLMGTSEFVVAGLLPDIASSLGVSVSHAGLSITVFAFGMIVGAPLTTMLTLQLPRRITLASALAVFAAGHVVGALASEFTVLLAARFVTAMAAGAFWAVASVVAAGAAGSRALGVVNAGGISANVLGVPVGAFGGQLFGWRGVFWALALLAVITAGAVARFVTPDTIERPAPSIRAEVRALRSSRLWLVLAACAGVTGGVLSIYSYIAPLLTDGAGLPERFVPGTLMAFGLAALIGSIVAGRLGERHPYRTTLTTATVTLFAAVGIWVFADSPAPLLVSFTILGLTGLAANPVLAALAIRFGADAPTIAAAMLTSFFNLGTAVGTAASAFALETSLGTAGPVLVGIVGAALTIVPLGILGRQASRRDTRNGLGIRGREHGHPLRRR